MKTQQNLWNTVKAVLGGIFITLSAYIRHNHKKHRNDLLMKLKMRKNKNKPNPNSVFSRK